MDARFRLPFSVTLTAAILIALFVTSDIQALAGTEDIPLSVRPKLKKMFDRAGCVYPPQRLTLLALKSERRLEVWAENFEGRPCLVAEYPILAASGTSGPKLMRGDCQVPEGIYSVVKLNPYSKFHLSMKIDYPNEFDREKGESEGRSRLGDNIFIHGSDVSKGCIAVGDAAIEELFLLAYDMDGAPVKVIIAPYDLRKSSALVRTASTSPSWLPELYGDIKREMSLYNKTARVTGAGMTSHR